MGLKSSGSVFILTDEFMPTSISNVTAQWGAALWSNYDLRKRAASFDNTLTRYAHEYRWYWYVTTQVAQDFVNS